MIETMLGPPGHPAIKSEGTIHSITNVVQPDNSQVIYLPTKTDHVLVTRTFFYPFE